jgi:acyl-CoA thioester hydrolase
MAHDETRISSTIVNVRVRYVECDPMNVAHHSAYPIWLELARTELLRQQGVAYRGLEERGILFVVARLSLRYRRPARYDDVLEIHCRAEPSPGRVKIEHYYEIRRDGELLATGQTTLGCVDREGRLQQMPPELMG